MALLSLVFDTAQDHLPRDFIAHSRLGKKMLQTCPWVNLMAALSKMRFLFPGDLNLWEKKKRYPIIPSRKVLGNYLTNYLTYLQEIKDLRNG